MENRKFDHDLRFSKKIVHRLGKELNSLFMEEDQSVPYQVSEYFYYKKWKKGNEHPIYCRKKHSMKGKEEILLDMNEVAEHRENPELGTFVISPNQKYLAFSLSDRGQKAFTLHIRHLSSGKLDKQAIGYLKSDVVWSEDSRFVFYTTTLSLIHI